MIVTDAINIDDYHASEYVSHSKLRTFRDVGAYGYHARHLTVGGPKRETTDAMRFGQAFETFVQDPATFASKYVEEPIITITGNADDALLAEALAAGVTNEDGKSFTRKHAAKTVHLAMIEAIHVAQGKRTMKRADMIRIERMAEAFASNADAQAVIRGARTQVTLRDDFAGLDMLPGIQSRPDWYHDDGTAPDLKTTSRFEAFDNDIVSLGYHTQAALIDVITGARREHPLIACESEWPWRCQVVDVPHDLLEAGARWCMRVLAEMRECYTRDEWPKCVTRRTASVPRWARTEDE